MRRLRASGTTDRSRASDATMIRILIADDHHLFREAVARLLNDEPDLTVVGTVANGKDAVARTAECRPDVVLLDVNMPGVGGLEAARHLAPARTSAKILMLTVSEEEEDLFAAIRAGARGYLLKNANREELVAAIRQVAAGQAVVSPAMAVKLLREFATLPPADDETGSAEGLTPRELDVLKHVEQGLSNKEIGRRLAISPHTVKAHLRSTLDKLHLRSRTQAAAWAARHGLRHDPD